jgi:predicted transporter
MENMLLAFAPFIAFAAIDRLVGPVEGMFAGFAVSAALLIHDWSQRRTAKVLEIGTAALFGALGCYALLADPAWSLMGVRLVVDSGLLLIVLISIAIRQPFTLQYARERVPAEVLGSAEFVRTNYMITAVWALAFAIMVAADLVLITMPDLPPRFGIIATVLALAGAFKFTASYPERGHAAAQSATPLR